MAHDLKEITDKEKLESDLRTRFDNDRKLHTGVEYKMENTKSETIDDVINVTPPNLKLFGNEIISTICKAIQQIVVSYDKDDQDKAAEVENILSAALVGADDLLMATDEFPLKWSAVEQNCVFGRMAARVMFQKDGKLVEQNILPYDQEFFCCDYNGRDMAWSSYKIEKTPAMMKAEFGMDVNSNTWVREVWDTENCTIYLNDKEPILNQFQNPFGYVPVVYQKVLYGTSLKHKDVQKYTGESVYYMVRDIWDNYCMNLSIYQSMNFYNFKKTYLRKLDPNRLGSDLNSAEQITEYPVGPGKVIDMLTTEDMTPLEITDLTRAGQLIYSILSQLVQDCTFPAHAYGSLNIPLSGVALMELTEGMGNKIAPRIQALGLFYRRMCNMIASQLQAIGGTVMLGEYGREKKYETAVLRGEYTIQLEYNTKSETEDIARFAKADKASEYFDDETVLADVLKVKNPAGILAKIRAEKASELSPVLNMRDTIKSLINQERNEEAWIVYYQLQDYLDGRGQMPVPADGGKQQQPGKPMIDLFGDAGKEPARKELPDEMRENALRL